jgi:hypothetical protein
VTSQPEEEEEEDADKPFQTAASPYVVSQLAQAPFGLEAAMPSTAMSALQSRTLSSRSPSANPSALLSRSRASVSGKQTSCDAAVLFSSSSDSFIRLQQALTHDATGLASHLGTAAASAAIAGILTDGLSADVAGLAALRTGQDPAPFSGSPSNAVKSALHSAFSPSPTMESAGTLMGTPRRSGADGMDPLSARSTGSAPPASSSFRAPRHAAEHLLFPATQRPNVASPHEVDSVLAVLNRTAPSPSEAFFAASPAPSAATDPYFQPFSPTTYSVGASKATLSSAQSTHGAVSASLGDRRRVRRFSISSVRQQDLITTQVVPDTSDVVDARLSLGVRRIISVLSIQKAAESVQASDSNNNAQQ